MGAPKSNGGSGGRCRCERISGGGGEEELETFQDELVARTYVK